MADKMMFPKTMKEFIEKLIERLSKFQEISKVKGIYGEYMAYSNAKEIVNQLAEEYNGGWIPCSSGTMPNENETIMLTFKNSAGLHVGEATYKNRMFFYVTDTEFGYYEEVYKNPIAWKPKDAPYQPKGE